MPRKSDLHNPNSKHYIGPKGTEIPENKNKPVNSVKKTFTPEKKVNRQFGPNKKTTYSVNKSANGFSQAQKVDKEKVQKEELLKQRILNILEAHGLDGSDSLVYKFYNNIYNYVAKLVEYWVETDNDKQHLSGTNKRYVLTDLINDLYSEKASKEFFSSLNYVIPLCKDEVLNIKIMVQKRFRLYNINLTREVIEGIQKYILKVECKNRII